MSIRKLFLGLSLISLVLGYGCRPQIVGQDAAVYSSTTLFAVVSADLTSTYNASVKALKDLEIDLTDQAKDVFSAKVVGKAADGKVIRISMKPREEGGTSLTIRVGTFGDKFRSGVIYEKIKKNLAGK